MRGASIRIYSNHENWEVCRVFTIPFNFRDNYTRSRALDEFGGRSVGCALYSAFRAVGVAALAYTSLTPVLSFTANAAIPTCQGKQGEDFLIVTRLDGNNVKVIFDQLPILSTRHRWCFNADREKNLRE